MNFIETTEIDARSLRHLAQSRGCTLAKDGSEYRIEGANAAGILLSDDECWDLLSSMPPVQTRRTVRKGAVSRSRP